MDLALPVTMAFGSVLPTLHAQHSLLTVVHSLSCFISRFLFLSYTVAVNCQVFIPVSAVVAHARWPSGRRGSQDCKGNVRKTNEPLLITVGLANYSPGGGHLVGPVWWTGGRRGNDWTGQDGQC